MLNEMISCVHLVVCQVSIASLILMLFGLFSQILVEFFSEIVVVVVKLNVKTEYNVKKECDWNRLKNFDVCTMFASPATASSARCSHPALARNSFTADHSANYDNARFLSPSGNRHHLGSVRTIPGLTLLCIWIIALCWDWMTLSRYALWWAMTLNLKIDFALAIMGWELVLTTISGGSC